MSEKLPQDNEPVLVTRRGAIKFAIGAVSAAAATTYTVENFMSLYDSTSEIACEDVVPIGETIFDVYGNTTDSNELLHDGYKVAVHKQECRDRDK